MSTQPEPEFVEESVSEQTVRNYLEAHPDFFERNSTLLDSLELPHASGGAVSLVEGELAFVPENVVLQQARADLLQVSLLLEDPVLSQGDGPAELVEPRCHVLCQSGLSEHDRDNRVLAGQRGEAGLFQVVGNPAAAHTVMAYNHGLPVFIKLVDVGGNSRHRDQHAVIQIADFIFPRLAYIQQ